MRNANNPQTSADVKRELYPYAYIQADELHSDNEQRQAILGYSATNRLLAISFTQRAPNVIRIISARLATRRERRIYEEAE